MARIKSEYRARAWVDAKPLPKCKPGCIHQRRWDHTGETYCAYIFDTGHPRPCPGGPDCTEYKKGRPVKKHPDHWDDY